MKSGLSLSKLGLSLSLRLGFTALASDESLSSLLPAGETPACCRGGNPPPLWISFREQG